MSANLLVRVRRSNRAVVDAASAMVERPPSITSISAVRASSGLSRSTRRAHGTDRSRDAAEPEGFYQTENGLTGREVFIDFSRLLPAVPPAYQQEQVSALDVRDALAVRNVAGMLDYSAEGQLLHESLLVSDLPDEQDLESLPHVRS